MRKFLIAFIIVFAIYEYLFYIPAQHHHTRSESYISVTHPIQTSRYTPENLKQVTKAYQQKQSHIQVQGSGNIIKILKDDTRGSRHQRFIIALPSGQTLLIAHNIDLAPKIMHLSKGDTVEFYGEYIWNQKGGTIHWTHHDPRKKHISGWLKHKGRIYQ